jgi:hypothetical protein
MADASCKSQKPPVLLLRGPEFRGLHIAFLSLHNSLEWLTELRKTLLLYMLVYYKEHKSGTADTWGKENRVRMRHDSPSSISTGETDSPVSNLIPSQEVNVPIL